MAAKESRDGLPRSPREEAARDRIVRQVIRGLYDGRYEPGQRLLEAQITTDYDVSRGPVREALNRLAAMGVVILTPQRGAHIRELSVEEAVDILVVVQTLVGTAARLAAERIDRPGARKRLGEAFDRLTAFDQSSAASGYARARDAFYGAITAIAGNPELARILPGVQIHLIRVQFRATMQNVDRRRHRDYEEILEAINAGKGSAAERAARKHIGRSMTVLLAQR